MHARFTKGIDSFGIRINDTLYKHCRDCGYRLQSKPLKLAAHYKRYHRDQEPAWLRYDERPLNSCYANFETYL